MNKCPVCGKNCVDPKGCFLHKSKKPLKNSNKLNKTKKLVDNTKMFEFFLSLWDKRADSNGDCICFETGEKMSRSLYRDNTMCYHHLLFKSRYPEYKFAENNVVIILPKIHMLTHGNIDLTPKIKAETLKFKQQCSI